MIDLSERLSQIAGKVPKGSRIADIGTDHALLPVYLALNKHIPFAVAGEFHPGPLAAAQSQVSAYHLDAVIDVRLGDGLEVIAAGEVDTIVLAGMGGSLMRSILTAGCGKLPGVKRIIVQPNVGESLMRHWFADNGWFLREEQILQEDDKIYEILVAEPHADANRLNDQLYADQTLACGLNASRFLLFRMGPYLIHQNSQIFILKWQSELDKQRKIVGNLSLSHTAEAKRKRHMLLGEIQQMEEVIQCLQKVRR